MNTSDNGIGITETQINNLKSFGIIGMRERASYLGGFLKTSGKGKLGTTVHLRIPITIYKTKRKNTNFEVLKYSELI
jgi:glucose-6-phosphate-specific signal transduction histidine kinase